LRVIGQPREITARQKLRSFQFSNH
jgi:hypothetical protein